MRYAKTEQGRAETRARQHDLSRSARNLLFILHPSREGGQWVALVQGASAADLERLLALGLIAPQPDQMPVPVPVPVAAGATLQQALQARSHSELYELLTVQARPRLGLIKGYKMVLDIERCGDAESLRALALRFVDAVRTARGDAAAGEIGRLLGAGR